MLIKVDRKDKNNSIYMCDKCKELINVNNKIEVFIAQDKSSPRKKWDLCKICYRVLIREVENRRDTYDTRRP